MEEYRKEGVSKSREKVFQKTLKKDLTNFRKCGIINELPLLKWELKNKKNCILKTEQCEKEKGKKNWNPWSIQIQAIGS